ncbi:unnamed protein product, partial [Phaeothamnion confervicola]
PRPVHFLCAACNVPYSRTISFNPWWALFQEECPTCRRVQVPRVDISHPANNVDSHTALLSAAAAASDGEDSSAGSDADSDSESGSDDEDDGGGSGGGGDLDGGLLGLTLEPSQAAKLLVLMCHARECPGLHKSKNHQEVCRSTKFLMLHIRDCSGSSADGALCPQPWCRPCKALLHHLLHCSGDACAICSPEQLPRPLQELR